MNTTPQRFASALVCGLCLVLFGSGQRQARGAETPKQPQQNDILRPEDLQRTKALAPGANSAPSSSNKAPLDSEPVVVDPGPIGGPPSDAVVLFDGGNLSAWKGLAGGAAKWKVENGVLEVNGTGDIVTTQEFGDVQLHVEWASPAQVKGEGQGRGNSGVYLQGRYEVQVLDSYQNKTYPNGQAGAFYGVAAPLVNACRKPGQWQTYDIIFHAPRKNAAGSIEPGSLTVLHNGVLVQDHVAVAGQSTTSAAFSGVTSQGPLMLQDHGNPVHYRNIWIRRL